MSRKSLEKSKNRSLVLAPPSSEEEEEPMVESAVDESEQEEDVDDEDEVEDNEDDEDEVEDNEDDEDEVEDNEEEETNGKDDKEEQDEVEVPVQQVKKKKPGLIYINSIPKHMNVTIVRELLGEYGDIGRVYLEPEKKFLTVKKTKKSKKPLAMHFTEGWVEFESKRVAKWVAANLNSKPITTRKKSRFCDVLWNIKYLPRFKWAHLSERMTYERAVLKQRRLAEISQARKEANFFEANLDKSERIKRFKKKNKNKEVAVSNE